MHLLKVESATNCKDKSLVFYDLGSTLPLGNGPACTKMLSLGDTVGTAPSAVLR